jgi:hypothetical protein
VVLLLHGFFLGYITVIVCANVITGFTTRPVLTKILMEVVAHQLEPQQLMDLRQEFKKFDQHDNGEIRHDDLMRVMTTA